MGQETLPEAMPTFPPLTRTKSGLNSGGDFTFQFGEGWGILVSADANSPVGPSATEDFLPSGPRKGQNKGQLPTDLIRVQPSCAPREAPLKCFPNSSIKRTIHMKDRKKRVWTRSYKEGARRGAWRGRTRCSGCRGPVVAGCARVRVCVFVPMTKPGRLRQQAPACRSTSGGGEREEGSQRSHR